jgi:hypothetical protein
LIHETRIVLGLGVSDSETTDTKPYWILLFSQIIIGGSVSIVSVFMCPCPCMLVSLLHMFWYVILLLTMKSFNKSFKIKLVLDWINCGFGLQFLLVREFFSLFKFGLLLGFSWPKVRWHITWWFYVTSIKKLSHHFFSA